MKLPYEWNVATLDEVCSGDLRTGPFGSQLHADEYVAEGVPVVMPKDIAAGRIVAKTAARITPERAQQLLRHKLQVGDVIFSRRGDVARAGLVFEVDEGFICGTGCLRARPNKHRVFPPFLNLLVQSPQSKRWLENNAVGQTMPNMNTEILSQLTFKLPSLHEQECISAITSTWDAAIEKTEQLIAAKELHFAAISHQLLTARKRLNGFATPWYLRRADEIFENTSHKGSFTEPLLSVTQNHGVIPRDMLEGRVTMPSGDTSGFKLVKPGNFVISLRSFQGGLEHSAYRGLVSPAYTVLSEKLEIDEQFFRHYFKSADFIKRLSVAVIGIRDGKQISFKEFCSIKLPFPSINEQKTIAAMLDQAECEIRLLRKYLEAIKTQKRGLMQKLLTGKWRIKPSFSKE